MAIVNFFGTSWDSEAGLGTKIGYVASALDRGVLPSQIKSWIASVDPANAVQEVYDLLGIPASDPQPVYVEPQPVYQQPAVVQQEPIYTPQPEPTIDQQVMDLLAQETEAQVGARPRDSFVSEPTPTPTPTPAPTSVPVPVPAPALLLLLFLLRSRLFQPLQLQQTQYNKQYKTLRIPLLANKAIQLLITT